MIATFESLINSTTEEQFLQIFQDSFSQQNQPFFETHQTILTACYKNPGLSPSPRKIKGSSPESLARAWLKKYSEGFESRISKRISKLPSTVADPMIDVIIKTRFPTLTIQHLEQIKHAHRLSMSAENILGLLLEEFLETELADYGWHCCWGEVIRYVDFCNVDGSLLQVKNRSNSENSASSSVRLNTSIEKWHRVDASKGTYNWHYFNEKYATDKFSEKNFIIFVQRVLTQNPDALAVEENNPWQGLSSLSDQI